MPTHDLIQAAVAVLKGYCSLHDSDPEVCGALSDAQHYGKLVGGFATLIFFAGKFLDRQENQL